MSAQPLGVILAGGRSSRFGSDKAQAVIGGTAMLDMVARALAPQCCGLIVAGRDWPGIARVDDLPRPGLGPLGGLAGALLHARDHGNSLVLTSGCDLPELPPDLVALLSPADAILPDQPTVGLWRSAQADALLAWLATSQRRSILAWAEAAGARRVAGPAMVNVNQPEDMAAIRPPADLRSSR